MRETTGAVRKVWFLLASKGGRWNTSEIKQALPLLAAANFNQTLRDMTDNGQIVRYEAERLGERAQYGVTLDCRIPSGISLRDIVTAGVVVPQERAA